MRKKPLWKKIKVDSLSFDAEFEFHPPKDWDNLRLMEAYKQIAGQLKELDRFPNLEVEGWLALVKKIPEKLRVILIKELCLGNGIVSIRCDWPDEGSIYVNMKYGFSEASKVYSRETVWCCLDDPHYRSEEISQKENGVTYLLSAPPSE
jgi:hypothetical protein